MSVADIPLDPIEPVQLSQLRLWSLGNELNFTTLQPSFQALSSSDYFQNSELIQQNFKVIKTLSELNFLALLKQYRNYKIKSKKAVNRGAKRSNTSLYHIQWYQNFVHHKSNQNFSIQLTQIHTS